MGIKEFRNPEEAARFVEEYGDMLGLKPEEKSRIIIDAKLRQAGWVIQNKNGINLSVSLGVAVREFSTSNGPVDYALFINGKPVGVVEAKPSNAGEGITTVEAQTSKYANSTFKNVPNGYKINYVYEATDKLTRFTDYSDVNYRSRAIFTFKRPENLNYLLLQPDTIRNNLKHLPPFLTKGFRDCQINAITNLEKSLANNRPRALIQMATGAGKTFTAITAAYRMLKFGKFRRILFLVDTKSLGEQAEREFMAYKPYDEPRPFSEIYGVQRLRRSYMSQDNHVYISTIQRMYSILKGEELDESAEEHSLNEVEGILTRPTKEVVYNEKYPPEFFDCIIVDECHRSIYNVWNQVLEYFDAFIIGLTATPDNRTFAYFNQNIVSEYSREQAIVDGVNVGEDVYVIQTKVTGQGAKIARQKVQYRNRLTRSKRWEQLDEDLTYAPSQLDKDIVNPSQIRTVIRAFKNALGTELYPNRTEVPKTLIFAKTDSHADDIIQIVREEFGQGNEFCKKITYSAANPEQALSEFRNDYNPRIAVTVDMIATGIDVKPIEVLLFMRDVRSKNYYEQMIGRGTRVLNEEDLKKVSPSATGNKDHFVIVDAVGASTSKKTATRTLEHKPSVSLANLMLMVSMGHKDPETVTSLANRIIRLNNQMNEKQRQEFHDAVGCIPRDMANNLLNAYDEDKIIEKAQEKYGLANVELVTEAQKEELHKEMLALATAPFAKAEVRDYIENVRKSFEQVIDSVNLDEVLFSGFSSDQKEQAEKDIQRFHDFIEAHKNEIMALRIIYDQAYNDRPMAIKKLAELYDKLQLEHLSTERLWKCYSVVKPDKVKKVSKLNKLTDLIALVRFEVGYSDDLAPFADRVNYNFMQWTMRHNAGAVHFTAEQMMWLRMIKDHIVTSLSIEAEDLDFTPFDGNGGLARFYEIFGDSYEDILHEMNAELVA